MTRERMNERGKRRAKAHLDCPDGLLIRSNLEYLLSGHLTIRSSIATKSGSKGLVHHAVHQLKDSGKHGQPSEGCH